MALPMPDTSTIEELIERVEKATGPDRELDLEIGKALAQIPPEAEWKPQEDDSIFKHLLPKTQWELPAFSAAQADWNNRMKAYIGSPEYYADKEGSWVRDNPPPHESIDWRTSPASGHVPYHTASTDAALSLAERLFPGVWWHIAKGRSRPDEPLYGIVLLRGGTEDDVLGEAEHECLEHAIILATLRALSSQKPGNANG